MTAEHKKPGTAQSIDDPRAVAMLAKLVHAFRAGDSELSFAGQDLAILKTLAEKNLVDLTNDGFDLTDAVGTYVRKSPEPPVTAQGILFLERLPVDKFIDQPGLFRFLGWI